MHEIAPYLVVFSAMLFAALSAWTLFNFVGNLDPPDVVPASKPPIDEHAAA
jgi:hypothetical protein